MADDTVREDDEFDKIMGQLLNGESADDDTPANDNVEGESEPEPEAEAVESDDAGDAASEADSGDDGAGESDDAAPAGEAAPEPPAEAASSEELEKLRKKLEEVEQAREKAESKWSSLSGIFNKRLEESVQEQLKALGVKEPEPSKKGRQPPSVQKLVNDFGNALEEGDKNAVTKLLSEILEAQKSTVEGGVDSKFESEKAERLWREAARDTFRDYPVLNPQADGRNDAAIDMLQVYIDGRVARGVPAHEALNEGAKQVAGLFGLTQPADTPGTAKSDTPQPPPAKNSAREKQARDAAAPPSRRGGPPKQRGIPQDASFDEAWSALDTGKP